MALQTSSPHGPPDVSVLVVDDDDHAREGMVRLIQTLGVRARAARDGEEALALVPEVQPISSSAISRCRASMGSGL
jgi:PleD family two-component response regulator